MSILNQGLKPAWDAIALHKRDPYQFSSLDQLLLREPGKMKIESNIAMVEEWRKGDEYVFTKILRSIITIIVSIITFLH